MFFTGFLMDFEWIFDGFHDKPGSYKPWAAAPAAQFENPMIFASFGLKI